MTNIFYLLIFNMDIQEEDMKFLTVKEAAEVLRVGPRTIYGYIYSRQIPYVKLGGKILIPANELEAFISKKLVRPRRHLLSSDLNISQGRP